MLKFYSLLRILSQRQYCINIQLKKSQKSQIKPLVEELEQKVAHFNEEIFNADEIKRRNQEKVHKKMPRKRGETMANSRRGRKKKTMDVEEEDEMQAEDVPAERMSRSRPPRARRMRIIQESQDE